MGKAVCFIWASVCVYIYVCVIVYVCVCVHSKPFPLLIGPPPPGHLSSGGDRKLALLEDLFRKFPSMPVNVEIKELNCGLIQKVGMFSWFSWSRRYQEG